MHRYLQGLGVQPEILLWRCGGGTVGERKRVREGGEVEDGNGGMRLNKRRFLECRLCSVCCVC